MKALKKRAPLLGWNVAIDASDMPAYANGQRFKSKTGPGQEKYSDPDASCGHRSAVSTRKGGGFYGYGLHTAVCSKTDLPLALRVAAAKADEGPTVAPLLDALKTRGINPETCAMYKRDDTSTVHNACIDQEVLPVVALRKTPDVKRSEHKPPDVRARRVAVPRCRPQTQCEQVAFARPGVQIDPNVARHWRWSGRVSAASDQASKVSPRVAPQGARCHPTREQALNPVAAPATSSS